MVTAEEMRAISAMPDGVQGWVTVRVVTDGGSLRLYPEGDRLDDPSLIREIEFDPGE